VVRKPRRHHPAVTQDPRLSAERRQRDQVHPPPRLLHPALQAASSTPADHQHQVDDERHGRKVHRPARRPQWAQRYTQHAIQISPLFTCFVRVAEIKAQSLDSTRHRHKMTGSFSHDMPTSDDQYPLRGTKVLKGTISNEEVTSLTALGPVLAIIQFIFCLSSFFGHSSTRPGSARPWSLEAIRPKNSGQDRGGLTSVAGEVIYKQKTRSCISYCLYRERATRYWTWK